MRLFHDLFYASLPRNVNCSRIEQQKYDVHSSCRRNVVEQCFHDLFSLRCMLLHVKTLDKSIITGECDARSPQATIACIGPARRTHRRRLCSNTTTRRALTTAICHTIRAASPSPSYSVATNVSSTIALYAPVPVAQQNSARSHIRCTDNAADVSNKHTLSGVSTIRH